jgi:pantothenate kinase
VSIDALARDAIDLAHGRERVILGIAGSPGAGKSTLAHHLLDRITDIQGVGWAAQVPMDGFHLADAQLRRLGAMERKGAPDTFDAAGYASVLARVRTRTDGPVYVPGGPRQLRACRADGADRGPHHRQRPRRLAPGRIRLTTMVGCPPPKLILTC